MGSSEGIELGLLVGSLVGSSDGTELASLDGTELGSKDGTLLGTDEGSLVGRPTQYHLASELVLEAPLAKILHSVLTSPGPSRNFTMTSSSTAPSDSWR